MQVTNALAGIAVSDLQASITFYSLLLGRAPDQRLIKEIAEYRSPVGGWMQIFEDDERVGKASMTLVVEDLDATLETIEAAGIHHLAPTRTKLVDTAIVNDPDGNQIVFAQSKSSSNRATA